jgi:hypothetical protein
MSVVLPGDKVLVPLAAALLSYGFSADRVAQMIYLADWKTVIEHGHQATRVIWTMDRDGSPDLRAVEGQIETTGRAMKFLERFNPLQRVSTKDVDHAVANVDRRAADSLKHVIENTKAMNGLDLDILVASTHPCLVGWRDDGIMDLVGLAKEYVAGRTRT